MAIQYVSEAGIFLNCTFLDVIYELPFLKYPTSDVWEFCVDFVALKKYGVPENDGENVIVSHVPSPLVPLWAIFPH